MKYEAIIFDLFGTLVGDIIGPPYTDVLKRMATTLSVSSEEFIQKWADTSYERNTGAFRSVKENIVHICKELRVDPSDTDINLSARIRHDYVKKVMMKPRSGTVETLSKLKQLDLKIGLISNCTPDAPTIWPKTLYRLYLMLLCFRVP